MPPYRPAEERFEEKVDRSGGPDACHLWTSPPNGGGYGSFGPGPHDPLGRRVVGAHVWALERKLGRPLREGYECGHTCHVRLCVNELHLEEVTYSQNQADRWALRLGEHTESHCRNGHLRSEHWDDTAPAGVLKCRECRNDYSRSYRSNLSAEERSRVGRRSGEYKKQWVAKLSPEQLATYKERTREYQRQYRARKRQSLA